MKIYHVAKTRTNWPQIAEYLAAVGAADWNSAGNRSCGEVLAEIAGRLCYKSFKVGLNKNVTKIREGNFEYLGNILKQKHGSVLEHSVDSFIITGVSRVLTHELVRHRHLSVSQESLRYVRIEEIDLVDAQWNCGAFDAAFFAIKRAYRFLLKTIEWDLLDFKAKKKITSAVRRLIPMGQKTSLLVTANARAWRWMIEARTAEGAEEEIRKLFLEIFRKLSAAYPNIYQDAKELSDGTVRFENSKI